MKVSEKVRRISTGFNNSTHSFFAMLADALQKKIEMDTGIKVEFAGKSVSGDGCMSGTLTGKFFDSDSRKVEEVGEKLEGLIDELKNPSNLLGLLK